MCEIRESESVERRLESLAFENERLRGENATLRFEVERSRSEAAMLGHRFDAACEVADRFKAEAERLESALRSIADHADEARDQAGYVPALAAFLCGIAMQALDAAPAGDEPDDDDEEERNLWVTGSDDIQPEDGP